MDEKLLDPDDAVGIANPTQHSTHKVLILGRNSIDELLGAQGQLPRLGVLDGVGEEMRLGLRRNLRRLLRAHKALLHRLLDHCDL